MSHPSIDEPRAIFTHMNQSPRADWAGIMQAMKAF